MFINHKSPPPGTLGWEAATWPLAGLLGFQLDKFFSSKNNFLASFRSKKLVDLLVDFYFARIGAESPMEIVLHYVVIATAKHHFYCLLSTFSLHSKVFI